MTQKRLLSSGQDQLGSLSIKDVFTSKVSSHLSLNVLKEETPTT